MDQVLHQLNILLYPNRFLALLIQVGFAILFFSSNAIWDLIGIEEIEKIYRYVIHSLDKYEN